MHGMRIRLLPLVAVAVLGGTCDQVSGEKFFDSNFDNLRLGGVSTAPGDPLTVMTYNIRVGYGIEDFGVGPHILRDAPKQLGPVIDAIASVDPDVVALQEVQGEDQARALAEALDMNFTYDRHGTFSDDWWGLAILSKYEILAARKYQLSKDWSREETRSLVIATLDIHGQPVTFVTAHIGHSFDRESALRTTRNAILNIPPPVGPAVFLGDLNTLPGSPALDRLWGFDDTAEVVQSPASDFLWERGTFIGYERELWYWRIDYIWVDHRAFDVQEVSLIDEAHWDASDHLGVYARITLR